MTNKIITTLLGYSPQSVKKMIITPLHSVYMKILQHYPKCIEHKGFYENAEIKGINGDSCLIICIPQGIQGQDICCISQKSRIVFLGYAGGLTNDIRLGEIYEVGTAVTTEGECVDLFCSSSLPKIKCGYSPSLLGTPAEQYTSMAQEFHCDSVDMETVYCAKASKDHNHRFSSFLLITDKPAISNFWELNSTEKKAIEVGTKRLIDTVISLCEEMIKNV